MHCYQKTLGSIALTALLASCGNSSEPAESDSGPAPDAIVRTDASCGDQSQDIPLAIIDDPPDLLIILDKSGSMTTNIGPPQSPTRWQIMKDVLSTIVTNEESNIHWGIKGFPDEGICGVSSGVDVAIAADNAGAINSWLSLTDPSGNTPAHLALEDALAIYGSMPVNPAGRFVLFATDGAPNCGGDPAMIAQETGAETIAAVEALAAAGIGTYVLGFGNSEDLDPAVLNAAAQAGGNERPGGPPHYFAVNDSASLTSALEEISGGVTLPSCAFEVTQAPQDPNLVTVSLDGEAVPRNLARTFGWDYFPDESTITFFGDTCEQLQQGANSTVRFVFGCAGPIIE